MGIAGLWDVGAAAAAGPPGRGQLSGPRESGSSGCWGRDDPGPTVRQGSGQHDGPGEDSRSVGPGSKSTPGYLCNLGQGAYLSHAAVAVVLG